MYGSIVFAEKTKVHSKCVKNAGSLALSVARPRFIGNTMEPKRFDESSCNFYRMCGPIKGRSGSLLFFSPV